MSASVEKPVDEQQLATQSKYKGYCEEVASALELFEKAKEWADLIKNLQKLSKVRPPCGFFSITYIGSIKIQIPNYSLQTDGWEAIGPVPQ
jgi:hypothetical protein